MASSGPIEKTVFEAFKDQSHDTEDFIEGIKESIIDFSKGRYKVFEDDDKLEDYLMAL